MSISITKALEVELVALLAAFRDYVLSRGEALNAETDDDRLIIGFVKGGRAPALGQLGDLLKTTSSGAQKTWTDFVDGIEADESCA